MTTSRAKPFGGQHGPMYKAKPRGEATRISTMWIEFRGMGLRPMKLGGRELVRVVDQTLVCSPVAISEPLAFRHQRPLSVASGAPNQNPRVVALSGNSMAASITP